MFDQPPNAERAQRQTLAHAHGAAQVGAREGHAWAVGVGLSHGGGRCGGEVAQDYSQCAWDVHLLTGSPKPLRRTHQR